MAFIAKAKLRLNTGMATSWLAQSIDGSYTGFGRKSPTISPSSPTFHAVRIAVGGTASSGP